MSPRPPTTDQIDEAEIATRWISADARRYDRLTDRLMLAIAAVTLIAMALGRL